MSSYPHLFFCGRATEREITMLRNYLIIAVRNLMNQKIYTSINVLGLSIGMACCLLIFLFAKKEMSYNKQFENGDRIFKVIRETAEDSGNRTFNERTSGPLGVAIKEQFPEVKEVVRLYRRDGWVTVQNQTFGVTFCASDLNMVDFFGLELKTGDPKTALLDPNAVLLTERTAKTLFGEENPIGAVIQAEAALLDGDYKVAGILKDLPASSTLQFDLLTIDTRLANRHSSNTWSKRGWRFFETYVFLPEPHRAEELEGKMQSIILQHMGAEVAAKNRYHLQNFDSIYLYSVPQYHIMKADYGASGIVYGNINEVRLALLIALFILLIACVNFINLSTARSVKRAREVGLRKTVGASRKMIMIQFLGETVLLSAIAIVCAVGLVQLALPAFSNFVGKTLEFDIIKNPFLLVFPATLSILVGMIAGSYPAFYLSAFQPNEVLKAATISRGDNLRKFLVIFQFSISIVLVIGTTVSSEQLSYLRKKDLGFDRSQVVILPIFFQLSGGSREALDLNRKYNTVKQAFLSHPHVLAASASRFGIGGFSPQVRFEAEETGEQPYQFRLFPVEEDFISAFGINLLFGRNFTRTHTELTYSERQERNIDEMFILNETAARRLGWENPVGKRLEWRSNSGTETSSGTVIGLVEDFHFQSLRETVEPMVMVSEFMNLKSLYLKVDTSEFQETLGFLEATWKQFLPNRPFAFRFLNDRLDQLYQEEARLTRIFTAFSSLAIFVSCLGLFGLASSIAEQRTKEIGIRKVLGASTGGIITLLIRDFAKPVTIAAFISIPIAYYLMRRWLEDFPYRIELAYDHFLVGILMAFVVALVAVGYQAFSAALANPADALRHE